MPLFNSNSKLEILNQIKEIPFQLERQIQHLVEANLNKLLGLEFVKSEFTISGSVQRLRIDTLAFDRKNKAFVIIEYKQDKNFSVVDQGYAYLSAMLNNKADFILEYNEARKMNRSSAVAWIGLNPGLFLFPRALPLIKKKPLILKIFRLLCGR